MLSLLDLAQARVPMKKAAGTHGGEWQGPCPRCGGRDRFHVWPDRQSTGMCTVPGLWGCRACDESGDAIKFLQHMDGLSFKEACAKLGQELKGKPRPVNLKKKAMQNGPEKLEPAPEPALPPAEWRERNAKLVQHAHEALLQNEEWLAWLAARGIGLEAVKCYKLGWLVGQPGTGKQKSQLTAWYTRARKAWGLPNEKRDDGSEKRTFRFPRGLVIPRFANGDAGGGEVVGLRIRRPDYDRDPERGGSLPHLKYMAFKGGPVAPLLINPDWAARGAMLAYTVQEAELDAMAAAEAARAAGLPCGAVALCSNSARPTESLHKKLAAASCLLLGLDFDSEDSGGKKFTDKALAKWLATYPRAKDWPAPIGKDVGEAFAQGVNLALWLEAGLPPALQSVKLTYTEKPHGRELPAEAGRYAQEGEEAEPAAATPAPVPVPDSFASAFPDAALTLRGPLGPQLAELREVLGAYPWAVFVKRNNGGVAMCFDAANGGPEPDWNRLEALRRKVLDSIALREWLFMHPDKQVHVRNFDKGMKI